MTDLKKIIRLAEAATPGPWFTDRKKEIGPRSDVDDQSHGMIVACADAYSDEDAAFIAAANPATVKAMAERLMLLEEALEWIKQHEHSQPASLMSVTMGKVAREALEAKP